MDSRLPGDDVAGVRTGKTSCPVRADPGFRARRPGPGRPAAPSIPPAGVPGTRPAPLPATAPGPGVVPLSVAVFAPVPPAGPGPVPAMRAVGGRPPPPAARPVPAPAAVRRSCPAGAQPGPGTGPPPGRRRGSGRKRPNRLMTLDLGRELSVSSLIPKGKVRGRGERSVRAANPGGGTAGGRGGTGDGGVPGDSRPSGRRRQRRAFTGCNAFIDKGLHDVGLTPGGANL
jgi:hypothetical protein